MAVLRRMILSRSAQSSPSHCASLNSKSCRKSSNFCAVPIRIRLSKSPAVCLASLSSNLSLMCLRNTLTSYWPSGPPERNQWETRCCLSSGSVPRMPLQIVLSFPSLGRSASIFVSNRAMNNGKVETSPFHSGHFWSFSPPLATCRVGSLPESSLSRLSEMAVAIIIAICCNCALVIPPEPSGLAGVETPAPDPVPGIVSPPNSSR